MDCRVCQQPIHPAAAVGGHDTHPGCDPDWDTPAAHHAYQAAWRGVTITDQPADPFPANYEGRP